jgi:hypothetical protein
MEGMNGVPTYLRFILSILLPLAGYVLQFMFGSEHGQDFLNALGAFFSGS